MQNILPHYIIGDTTTHNTTHIAAHTAAYGRYFLWHVYSLRTSITDTLLAMLVCVMILPIPVRAQAIAKQSGMEARMTFGYPVPSVLPAQTSLWATYYHIWHARDTSAGVALRDMKGVSLGVQLTPRDWCMSGVEGTVRVTKANGTVQVFNYEGRGDSVQTDCAPYFNKGTLINPTAIAKTRWRLAIGEFGDGVGNLLLVPYRSLATDRAVIPTGTIVYIPQARGVVITLPSGKTVEHDGYFIASDIGGAIKGNHIDVFTGIATKNPFENFVKNRSGLTFSAYILTAEQVPPEALKDLTALHRP